MAKSTLLGGMRLVVGMGLGAGLMYLFDPRAGKRRRAIARDKMVHWSRQLNEAIGVTAQDVTYRVQGLLAETRSLWMHKPNSPDVVEARVRSKMGRWVSHPSAIEVTADEGGRVILAGSILAHEVDNLLSAVASIPGVTTIENRLETHHAAQEEPSLQSGHERPGEQVEIMQANWNPATRLLAGTVGSTLILNALRRPGLFSGVFGVVGLGLVSRAVTNKDVGRLLGLTDRRRTVDFQKTFDIAAPLEEVFRIWTNYAFFPQFMSHVRQIEELGDGRSRWIVAGPMGREIQWNVVVTENVPNQVFAWKTEPGSPVVHSGVMHFQRNEDGGTRIHIRLAYSQPAGVGGHLVASLFGADPKSQIDADLMRMKTLIETGGLPSSAAARPESGLPR